MGPPPYWPPGSPAAVTANQPSLPGQEGAGPHSAPQISPTSTDPRTLSAPVAQVASPGSDPAQSDSLSEAERVEDTYVVQLLEQASALSATRNIHQDSSAASEQTQDPKPGSAV